MRQSISFLTLSFLLATLAACANKNTAGPAAPSRASIQRIDFEADTPRQPPDGFLLAQTGPGAPPQWLVEQDPTSAGQVLAQRSADPTPNRFPLCIYNKPAERDVTISVAFKALSGQVDQAAGIVLRYHDKDNYYVVRANALENNIRFYKVENGVRTQLATADKPVSANQWHSLSISATGPKFDVFMDDVKLFSAEDNTFSKPGRVGLWTKADSVTLFDDLRISTSTGR